MPYNVFPIILAALVAGQPSSPWQLRATLPGPHRVESPMALPAVSVLAFSPDEATLAVGAGQHRMSNFEGHHLGTVTLWDPCGDVPTKRAVIELPGATQALVFAPNGRTLAVADDFDALRLYDVATGDERAVLAEPSPGRGPAYTMALAFSPDGGTLACVQLDWISLWDVDTGRQGASFRAYEGEFTTVFPPALAFAPDGETFAVGGLDGRVTLRDSDDGRVRAVLKGHEGAVLHVANTTDGVTLVSADRNGNVRLWEAGTGRERAVLDCHEGAVWEMTLSPDDRVLATQHEEIRLWDVSTGERRATIPYEPGDNRSSPAPSSFSPDGKILTTIGWDGALNSWDAATGRKRAGLDVETGIERVSFSPSGQTLAMACKDGGIRLWSWQP